ncbi:MAG: hypothetical protein V7607_5417 [Solirubrobacteraceae bacterium]
MRKSWAPPFASESPRSRAGRRPAPVDGFTQGTANPGGTPTPARPRRSLSLELRTLWRRVHRVAWWASLVLALVAVALAARFVMLVSVACPDAMLDLACIGPSDVLAYDASAVAVGHLVLSVYKLSWLYRNVRWFYIVCVAANACIVSVVAVLCVALWLRVLALMDV